MSLAFAILFYVATLVLVVGVVFKVVQYSLTPVPLKIPTTPAPVTTSGVVMRMFREVVFFESLFISTIWTWIFAWAFHMGLFAVLFRHGRYFHDLLPAVIVGPLKYAAFAMIIGLIGLLVRRIAVNRVRYISAPSDYAMLILLLLIGFSGAMMTFASHVDIVGVKEYFHAWMTFDFDNLVLPPDTVLRIHLFLVAVLMLIFPISKLLHAPGIFFSPTRNQADNPREVRHVAEWAEKLE